MITKEQYGRYLCHRLNEQSFIRQFQWGVLYCTKITVIFCVEVMTGSKLGQTVSLHLHYKGTELDRIIGQTYTQHV